MFDAILLFIPIIKYLGLIPIIVLIIILVINAKQARDGKYFINKSESPLALFSWIGGRFLDLFEIGIKTPTVDLDIDKNKSDIEIDIDKNKSDIEIDIDKDNKTTN